MLRGLDANFFLPAMIACDASREIIYWGMPPQTEARPLRHSVWAREYGFPGGQSIVPAAKLHADNKHTEARGGEPDDGRGRRIAGT